MAFLLRSLKVFGENGTLNPRSPHEFLTCQGATGVESSGPDGRVARSGQTPAFLEPAGII